MYLIECTEVPRIVPVIEVAAETSRFFIVPSVLESLDRAHRAEPPEIVRGNNGEKI